jgi:toxin ParE1/3/4
MLRIVVSPRAEDDIVGIAAYTLDRWGERQMSRYVDGLHARFAALAHFPNSGRRRDELGRGYRSIVHGSHIVFYRVIARDLVIVRVLHVRMSPERHLP